MNQKKKKQLTYWLSVAIIGIALGFGLQFVRAWTEPTTAPPNGNVGAPINTSSTAQTKAGEFTATSLKAGVIEGTTVKGTSQLCIGTDCRTAWPSGGTAPAPCQCSVNSGPGVLDYYNCGTTISIDPLYCQGGWMGYTTYQVDCRSTCVSPGVWIDAQCDCYDYY